MRKKSTALFTIVSNNYLHYAKTLFESVATHMPEFALYVAIVDNDPALARDFMPEATILSLEDLNLPHQQQFIFRYSVLELNTAVKPWVFEKMMGLGYENIIYADPDIYFYQPLEQVLHLLQDHHVVLTPHLLEPITDQKAPSELDIRRVGTYNLGFVALKNSLIGQSVIAWWQSKLEFDCVVDLEAGIFVDQSWMDLVPSLFSGVMVLRDLGHNVAYWNVFQRSLRYVKNQWLVGTGLPLVFFHFSGFNAFAFENVSKHQNRITLGDLPKLRPLMQTYSQTLIGFGAKNWADQVYGFHAFADGIQIPSFFRELYRADKGLQILLSVNPFASSDILFTFVKQFTRDGLSITYAMWSLWEARADLRNAFPLTSFQNIAAYYNWFVSKADIYFDAFVIQKHVEIASGFQSRVQILPKYHHLDLRESRISLLYEAILGREVDSQGLASYTQVMGTRFGLLKTILSLVFSRESRFLPKKMERLLNLGSVLLRKQKPEEQIVWTPKIAFADANQGMNTSDLGIYLNSSTEAADGFWVKRIVLIPVSDEFSGTLFVSGFYVADFMPNSHVTFLISVFVNDQLLYECRMVESQHFEFSVDWKVSFIGVRYLRLESSQAWIPKDIGFGEDQRELSWRLKNIRVGNVQLFDSHRQPALLPLEAYLPTPGINLVGYLAAELGIGEAARLLAKSCAEVQVPYSIVDVGYQSSNLQRDRSAWETASDKIFDLDLLYVNADQMIHTMAFLEKKGYEGSKKIAFWHWEQPTLPRHYQSSFRGLNEVWVPSNFVLDAVAKIAPVPVFKVAHAIDFSISQTASRAYFGLPESQFLVLIMYDFHSVQYRKNPQAAIETFKRVAKKHQNMCLVVKTINADQYPAEYQALQADLAELNVVLLNQYLTRQEVFDLESCCDTLLSLHRAEGFGFALAEMMFLGKPVIATGWSGNMEFMTPMNSFPVQYALKPLEVAVGPYELGQVWAEADVEHAAFCLEQLLLDSVLNRKISAQARLDIQTNFSPKVIGQQIRQRLALLQLK